MPNFYLHKFILHKLQYADSACRIQHTDMRVNEKMFLINNAKTCWFTVLVFS